MSPPSNAYEAQRHSADRFFFRSKYILSVVLSRVAFVDCSDWLFLKKSSRIGFSLVNFIFSHANILTSCLLVVFTPLDIAKSRVRQKNMNAPKVQVCSASLLTKVMTIEEGKGCPRIGAIEGRRTGSLWRRQQQNFPVPCPCLKI